MTQSSRLPDGGRIDRTRPLGFRFDGRRYQGFAGDTLASALLANGVRHVGRSFKYHRPRGVIGLGAEEPNAIVDRVDDPSRRDPNTRATMLELQDGLEAESLNRWPSLRWDLGATAGLISAALPAGFYYKTFKWPRGAWAALYEPFLRHMAGLGHAPGLPDPDAYAFRYAHCDLLVVGGGLAGITAALAAADDGRDVILCDDGTELGGALLSRPQADLGGPGAWNWLEKQTRALRAKGVRVLTRTSAFGLYADGLAGLHERLSGRAPDGPRERLWFVRAGSVVLAAGAIERPLVFRNNDRPGVMLASAAAGYAGRYAVLPGRRAVVCAQEDSAYEAALALLQAGAEVVVADTRLEPDPALARRLRLLGAEVIPGTRPINAHGRFGVRALDLFGPSSGRRRIDCDLVAMAGGWTPSIHLHSQVGGRTRWDEGLAAFLPEPEGAAAISVGACAGVFDPHAIERQAREAVRGAGRAPARRSSPKAAAPAPADPPPSKGLAFLDFQNDVTAKDLMLAAREGFSSIEHIKRYTTLGMATDQGRTSNINGLRLAAAAVGRPVPAVGHTTYRAPFSPVTFGALAGRYRGELFEPLRKTPLDGWAEANGAVFENVGLWRRARYFPRPGETMNTATARECLATRAAAGIFDASTLGKIEVVGPDAAEFMNRLYVNAWTKLEPGRCRYGVMLREDGFVLDDGVVGRLAADRFHVTTTTTGAPAVLHHMEDYLQTEFSDLRVWLTSTTEQWAVIALNGPAARDCLAPLVEGIDLSREAFPHMAVRIGRICGVPCRLFRVSFTGELGFEINVPPRFATRVWTELLRVGGPLGLTPYGTETMHVLRAEKGYVLIGQDTDGTVTADDLGLDWAIGKRKSDFVGLHALQRPGLRDPDRPQLVGLLSRDRRTVLEEGAQVVAGPGSREPLGHVTSAYWSAALGQPIALALVGRGRGRLGETLAVTTLNGPETAVEVASPVFLDREGARLDA